MYSGLTRSDCICLYVIFIKKINKIDETNIFQKYHIWKKFGGVLHFRSIHPLLLPPSLNTPLKHTQFTSFFFYIIFDFCILLIHRTVKFGNTSRVGPCIQYPGKIVLMQEGSNSIHHSFIHSFIHISSFILSINQWFIHSSFHSFIHSLSFSFCQL